LSGKKEKKGLNVMGGDGRRLSIPKYVLSLHLFYTRSTHTRSSLIYSELIPRTDLAYPNPNPTNNRHHRIWYFLFIL
jgi:hypothetical protein